MVANRVRKSFGVGGHAVEILHGITLSVSEGELCGVMGPSGCGKSTLMHCLAGLERPTEGSIALLGQDLGELDRTGLAKLRRDRIGFVFQSYNLIPTMSAYENVALPFRLRGARVERDRIMDALAGVGIDRLASAMPPSMSGGEQQRVALARVLAQRPGIVFADEPTGALDSASGELVMAELDRIAHDPGRGVLMVTHDPSVAAACDRVMFMLDGIVVEQLLRPDAASVATLLTALGEQARAMRAELVA